MKGENYYSKVWARLVYNRISNATWQATFSIPKEFEHNRCFNVDYMHKVIKNNDLAFDVFNCDFPRLRPDLQIALAGATHRAWVIREGDARGMDLRWKIEY